jgi:hypothetical protein
VSARRAPAPVYVRPAETPDEALTWSLDHCPTVLPPGWELFGPQSDDGRRYYSPLLQLMVILTARREQDGRRWLHLSCSHQRRTPTWVELREVKDIFFGPDRYAYQVLPPASHYVNINARVLHLWHCLDEDPLPDFTCGSGSL